MGKLNGEHKVGGGTSPRPLLREAEFRKLLGGISERKFHSLRAAGIIPAPLELGTRLHVWSHTDYEEAIQRLPRAVKTPEPESLAAGRRARIEKLKTGAGGAA